MTATRWTAVSPDPNSTEAHAFRRGRLEGVHAPAVRSRNDLLADVARGKRVLDVGCVDHRDPREMIAPLHRRLHETAGELVGVDVQKDGVARLRDEGFEVYFADVTQPGLREIVGTNYDLMVAGEIIEHLLDLSAFFTNAREVLKSDGLLMLSTPNPHSLYLALWNLMGRSPDSVDHVVYHWPSGMAEIADRCGFQLLEIRGEHERLPGWKHKVVDWAARVLSRLWPDPNPKCISLIYTLRPV